MTVVAWDGTTLAADRQADIGGTHYPVTKIRNIRGHLVGASGNFCEITDMCAWFERGAKAEDYPWYQRDDKMWVPMLVITPEGKAMRYERQPTPYLIEADKVAIGCGRDFAMGAMACGRSAIEAVEIAIKLDPYCGMGIDSLTLDGKPAPRNLEENASTVMRVLGHAHRVTADTANSAEHNYRGVMTLWFETALQAVNARDAFENHYIQQRSKVR